MVDLSRMLVATRGRGRLDWTDWFAYGYLLLGLVLMFGPVLWLVLSSFKSAAALNEFPPRLQNSVPVADDRLRWAAEIESRYSDFGTVAGRGFGIVEALHLEKSG